MNSTKCFAFWKGGAQKMSKRNIIFICVAIAIVLVIAIVIYFVVINNKAADLNEAKIIIEKYDENSNVEKTIEITDKKQIKEIEEICDNPSLEQDEDSPYIAIRNDVKLDLGNNKFFMIQLELEEYCYYEDANSDTKLVIKMPEGLLEVVNKILEENS